ncbi:MAG TPA: 2-C-methyl-D-erythritol 4-phosphate cytidylyltransferase [Bacteroidales bacterium]|nr:2-C-methyl-D-erythritol 4-phosphate cytidylyltransferase [Bacteroidales bacterium]
MKRRTNIAVIMAAGHGARHGTTVPKQYMELKGRLVLERAVDAFENHPDIDQIAIVVDPDETDRVEKMVSDNGWKKVTDILKGGKERYQSSLAAVKAFSNRPEDNLILHDAARPLVSERIITDVVAGLQQYRAVGVAVPVTDTLFFTGPANEHVIRVPERDLFMRAQTPQAFRISVLKKAYEFALAGPAFTATDDCGVVRRYMHREKIHIVRGDEKNSKITYPGDLEIMSHWLE